MRDATEDSCGIEWSNGAADGRDRDGKSNESRVEPHGICRVSVPRVFTSSANDGSDVPVRR